MLHFVVVFSSFALLTAAETYPDQCQIGPAVGGQCPTGYTSVPSEIFSGETCVDDTCIRKCVDQINPKTGVSDCPNMVPYCNTPAYYTLLTQQCPKTCGRCPSTACVDQINPKTGVSDCPNMVPYCNTPAYYTLLTQQCPKTCGRCSG